MNLSNQPFVWVIGNFSKLPRIQFDAQFLISRYVFSLDLSLPRLTPSSCRVQDENERLGSQNVFPILFCDYLSFRSVENSNSINGEVIEQTYDLRQRSLTRTVSSSGITTQTTQLTYDNVGQITQLKMSDNSTLNYTYDAAHRLTDIQDTLGNKVHYTLDTEGNRTQEDVYDPNNALSTTLTRSFDALNRLQTQTGL